jgi:hypothetical protein
MRQRSARLWAVALGALLVLALSATMVSAQDPTPSVNCTDEFSNQPFTATVVGTNADERFGPNEPAPYTIKSRDIVVTGGGNDTVDVTGLDNVKLCLGAGDDTVTGGAQATDGGTGFGFSIRGGPGNDRLDGTPFRDAIAGLRGRDQVNDPGTSDFDICRTTESAIYCEAVNPLFF